MVGWPCAPRERGAAPARRPGAVRAGRPGLVRRAGPVHPAAAWAGIFPVTPATLLAWQRKLIAKKVRHEHTAPTRPTAGTTADLDSGRIRRKPILNGLINEYQRAA
jgi:hypothetical protein